MPINILICEDHELMRKSLVAYLENEADFRVVAECSNGRELLELATRHRPDIVVLDVVLPELNGVEATRRLKAALPSVRVIALSNYDDEKYVRGMLRAGAVGYILKSGTAQELAHSIRRAKSGKVYLSPDVSSVLFAAQNSAQPRDGGGGDPPPERRRYDRRRVNASQIICPLSLREREVLQLIAEGQSTKHIAASLGISETTVKSHRENIKEKLDIGDTAGLTRYAIRIGLIRV